MVLICLRWQTAAGRAGWLRQTNIVFCVGSSRSQPARDGGKQSCIRWCFANQRLVSTLQIESFHCSEHKSSCTKQSGPFWEPFVGNTKNFRTNNVWLSDVCESARLCYPSEREKNWIQKTLFWAVKSDVARAIVGLMLKRRRLHETNASLVWTRQRDFFVLRRLQC